MTALDLFAIVGYVFVLCIVFFVIYHVVAYLAPIPEPYRTYAAIAVCLLFVLVLVGVVIGAFPYWPVYR